MDAEKLTDFYEYKALWWALALAIPEYSSSGSVTMKEFLLVGSLHVVSWVGLCHYQFPITFYSNKLVNSGRKQITTLV